MYDLNTIVAMNAKVPAVTQEQAIDTIAQAAMRDLLGRLESGAADATEQEVAKLLAAWLAKGGGDFTAMPQLVEAVSADDNAPAVSGHATRGDASFYAWNR